MLGGSWLGGAQTVLVPQYRQGFRAFPCLTGRFLPEGVC